MFASAKSLHTCSTLVLSRGMTSFLAFFLSNIAPKQLIAKALILVSSMLLAGQPHAGTVSGSLQKWAPLTVDFTGPSANETDDSPNPFLDYRLSVQFTSPTGNTYNVPGFFAGDGQGGGAGDHWQVRFAGDEVGQWRYSARLRSGSDVAIDTSADAGSAVPLAESDGQFTITEHASDAPGFLRYGRLEYTGEHYLKFRDGPYWIKGGTDSPENFLGYAGIDGTVDHGGSNFLHDYITHRNDARADDPIFSNAESGADSLGITGALNYLHDQGVNSIYFLPMNLGGDGQETFPFVGGANTAFNKTHYDISKLYQWNLVLNHAQRRGIALNIQLSETEPGNERWLDNGQLGVERKLFFRELIARFGYLLAAKWNLGEENDFPVSELRAHADYLDQLDWTEKPIAVHTQINNFRDYEELVGDALFSASSIQYDPPLADEFVETWRSRTNAAGRKWVIDMDENTGGVSDTNADTRRKQILYDVFFSGGHLEWYFGLSPLPLGGDTTAGDFRKREATWQTMQYARKFMEAELPFWRMEPADELVSGEANSFGGAEVFAADNEIYAVYLPNASGNPSLDLRNASGSFSQRWFNPRNGQFEGQTTTILGGQQVALGAAPSAGNDDWVVLVKSHNAPALPDFSTSNQAVSAPAITNDDNDELSTDAPAVEAEVEEQISIEEPSSNDATTSDDTMDDNAGDDETPTVEDVPNISAADDQANEPPAFNPLDDVPSATAGSQYRLSVVATDAEGIAPVITAETLPAGMQIASVVDGIIDIEWQVPEDATESVSFELLAIDVRDENLVARLPITIAVEPAPSSIMISDESVVAEQPQQVTDNDNVDDESSVADESVSSELPTPNTADVSNTLGDLAPSIVGAENGSLVVGQTYRKTIVPNDPEGIVASLRISALPGDSRFLDNGNGTRDFVWTPNKDDVGVHQVRFVATDSGTTPHVVQRMAILTVVESEDDLPVDANTSDSIVNFGPVFEPLDSMEVRAGDQISFAVRPIDPDGIPPILHVISPPEGALFSDNGDGTRTFSWEASADYVGTMELMFIATDSQDTNLTVEQTISLTVTEP